MNDAVAGITNQDAIQGRSVDGQTDQEQEQEQTKSERHRQTQAGTPVRILAARAGPRRRRGTRPGAASLRVSQVQGRGGWWAEGVYAYLALAGLLFEGTFERRAQVPAAGQV